MAFGEFMPIRNEGRNHATYKLTILIMKLAQNYIFYAEDRDGIKTIQGLKSCIEPSKTSVYKHLQNLLDFSTYTNGDPVMVGYMSARKWNKDSKYIKFSY